MSGRSVMMYGCAPMEPETIGGDPFFPQVTTAGITLNVPAAPRTPEIQKAVTAIFSAIEGLTDEETKRALKAVASASGVSL